MRDNRDQSLNMRLKEHMGMRVVPKQQRRQSGEAARVVKSRRAERKRAKVARRQNRGQR